MKCTVNRRRKVTASSDFDDTRKVVAAIDDDMDVEDTEEFTDTLDDVSDAVDDIQDAVEEIDKDSVNIEIDNNISGHYIAECEDCHQIFISAMIESDVPVEKITGTCPLCGQQTDQYLKWIICDVEEPDEEDNQASYLSEGSWQ